MDDNSLMIRVTEGDTSKLGILYERYKKPMYAYFYRVTCGDGSFSEDLVHQVFMRVIKYKHNFKGTGSFAKWIFHIAHHVAIDYGRQKRHHADFGSVQISSAEPSVHEEIEKKEKVMLLNRALQNLRDEDREIITLGKIEEIKYQDIADILGMTEGAVRVKIHRAMQELKRVYFELEKTY